LGYLIEAGAVNAEAATPTSAVEQQGEYESDEADDTTAAYGQAAPTEASAPTVLD